MDINYYKKYEPIDGKWYITKELGSGSFGRVFEIERKDFMMAKSALKIITIPSSQNEVKSYREENFDLDEKSVSSYFYGFVEEFTKEFELMLQLKGKSNIVSIEDFDVKMHTEGIGWDIFIRMELLTPMNKYFAENALKTRDVIRLGIDICKALELCQKYNIVHRDIKPSNIFVSRDGEFKLGDFGVARTLEKTSSGLSKKGTYTYMAPEVFKGEAYGANVDTYSLGIVMYKLLNNNKEPFKLGRTHEDEENALVARMKNMPMPKPENAEGRLAEIILKACSFEPKERYESPVRMREELESIMYAENEEKSVFRKREITERDLVGIVEKEQENDATQSVFGAQTQSESESVLKNKETKEDEELTVGIFGERRNNETEKTEYEPTRGIFDTEESNGKVQESEADFEMVQAEDKTLSVELDEKEKTKYTLYDKIVIIACLIVIFVVLLAGLWTKFQYNDDIVMIVCSLIIFVVLFAGLLVNVIHPNIEHNDVPNDLQQEVMAKKRDLVGIVEKEQENDATQSVFGAQTQSESESVFEE